MFNPRHWFQFADDTAVITSSSEDNQLLLHVFSKWCTWSGLIVRVEKCKTFGVRKTKTTSIQYKPYLKICNEMVPQVEINDRFKYLGKEFSYDMTTDFVEAELKEDMTSYLKTLDSLPLHPHHKVSVITKYIYSKLRWRLSIYSISETWTIQNLDNVVNKYIRKWLGMHVGANITHLTMPPKRLGLNFKSVFNILKQCNLSLRRLLSTSNNKDITDVYHLTKYKFMVEDQILKNTTSKDAASKLLQTNINEKVTKHLDELKEQSIIMKVLQENLSSRELQKWLEMITPLMANIYKFARKALIFCLANNSNLKRWNKSTTDKCYLCDKKQTQLHVLSNCIVSVNEKRYTWRHNSVLKTLSTYIMQLQQHGYELYIDIDGYSNPSQLFNSFRPDAVIRKGDDFIVPELTVCFETNIIKSRDYKKSKYVSLKDDINVNVSKFDLIDFRPEARNHSFMLLSLIVSRLSSSLVS